MLNSDKLSCYFLFKQKTAYEMRISDWSSDVCSSDLVAPFISDEAVTVEDLPILLANTVGGDDRHDVRHGAAQHGAAPHPAGVQIGIIGLRSYGRWKEQHFSAHQRHDARSFRIPLVPAYAAANRSVAGLDRKSTRLNSSH